jgi:hypothetical protein
LILDGLAIFFYWRSESIDPKIVIVTAYDKEDISLDLEDLDILGLLVKTRRAVLSF